VNRENGLGTDGTGNVYVSSFHSSMIRVFRHDGQPLSVFGQPGHSAGEFLSPGGLWIDSSNRLYVADSGNGRVQLFQLKAVDHAGPAERAAELASEPHSGVVDDKSAVVGEQ